MKIFDILNESRFDSQEYLNESIVLKKKKYFVVKNHNKEEILPGTKEEGYASPENAVRAMMNQTNEEFKKLSFEEKKNKIDSYLKRWNKDNNIKDSKPKKQFGFDQIIFKQD